MLPVENLASTPYPSSIPLILAVTHFLGTLVHSFSDLHDTLDILRMACQ
jgi:hypothetical protein